MVQSTLPKVSFRAITLPMFKYEPSRPGSGSNFVSIPERLTPITAQSGAGAVATAVKSIVLPTISSVGQRVSAMPVNITPPNVGKRCPTEAELQAKSKIAQGFREQADKLDQEVAQGRACVE
jgi:hypothetical protein